MAGAVEIVPMTPVIGAEVRGVNLADLADDGFESLRSAFLEHQVLFSGTSR